MHEQTQKDLQDTISHIVEELKKTEKDIEKSLTFRSIKGTNPEVGDFDEF